MYGEQSIHTSSICVNNAENTTRSGLPFILRYYCVFKIQNDGLFLTSVKKYVQYTSNNNNPHRSSLPKKIPLKKIIIIIVINIIIAVLYHSRWGVTMFLLSLTCFRLSPRFSLTLFFFPSGNKNELNEELCRYGVCP